jgi:hypothetical protein
MTSRSSPLTFENVHPIEIADFEDVILDFFRGANIIALRRILFLYWGWWNDVLG